MTRLVFGLERATGKSLCVRMKARNGCRSVRYVAHNLESIGYNQRKKQSGQRIVGDKGSCFDPRPGLVSNGLELGLGCVGESLPEQPRPSGAGDQGRTRIRYVGKSTAAIASSKTRTEERDAVVALRLTETRTKTSWTVTPV